MPPRSPARQNPKKWVSPRLSGLTGTSMVGRWDMSLGMIFPPPKRIRQTRSYGLGRSVSVKGNANGVCAMPEPRVPFNLDLIVNNPDTPIFWHEGEKAADAVKILFPNWIRSEEHTSELQ